MKYFFCLETLLFFISQALFAQPTAGTTGLLNIPTAEMQVDGTFMFGGSFLPRAMLHERLNYNTVNYYINITFLPFLETSYRCTLLQTKSTGEYNQQDRSFGLRARLLREQKIIPSLVIGGNDIYTRIEKGNQYFGALYIVSSKHFYLQKNKFGTSFGYGFKAFRNNEITGPFGGLSFSPSFLRCLDLMFEFDSQVFNIGGLISLFNHCSIVIFAYDMQYFSAGLSYRIFL